MWSDWLVVCDCGFRLSALWCPLSVPTVWLGWPHTAWLSFTELDKLWSMWSDWLVVCDCGFSPSALWRPLSTCCLPWVSLTLNQGISSRLLQQRAVAAPYLGRGVAPLSCHPWPWTWGSSSLPLLRHRSRCSFVWIPVFNSMGYTPTSKLLGWNCHCFSEKLHHVTFPLAVCDGPRLPTSSPTLAILSLQL